MKIIQGKIKFIAVPVPGDAKDFSIFDEKVTILGKLSELTEEQKHNLVLDTFDSIEMSIKCLFRSHGLELKAWLSPVIKMDYLPEYGCQKYPQECYASDLKDYEQRLPEAAEDYLIIIPNK